MQMGDPWRNELRRGSEQPNVKSFAVVSNKKDYLQPKFTQ